MSASKDSRERLTSWENGLAVLDDEQKESCLAIMAATAAQKAISENLPSELMLPLSRQNATVDSDPSSLPLLLGRKEIRTIHEFYSWYSDIEDGLTEEEDSPHGLAVDQLNVYRRKCDEILAEVTSAVEQLDELENRYMSVATKTEALHEACDHLLQDQTKLVRVAESIRSKLAYFDEVEELNQKFASPSFSVVDPSFVPKLARLDECVAFLKSHSHFKESAEYQARFQRCLARALSLVRSHVVNLFRGTTQQVMPPKGAPPYHTDSSFSLFYGKFRFISSKIKNLMEQIEQRASSSEDYAQVLQDCQQCYGLNRLQLLKPSIQMTVERMLKEHEKDKCALLRAGCAFMVRLCQDEHQLYFHFFTKPSEALDNLLESLSSCLYDSVRPLIIHINHLETLAELCSILKVEMLEDHIQQKLEQLSVFGTVVSQMLQDVQERLVYRAQIYIQNDIANYKAAPGDLAYPEKLEIRSEKGESDLSSQSAPVNQHAMWYPTVRRTLVCLSKLYRCINKPIFEGIAQEVLAECIRSLKTASVSIVARKGHMDGQLFLIKHLLILREQIAPFDVDFTVKEVSLDFSKLRTAAQSLISHRNNLFLLNQQNAFLEFLLEGQPQLKENYLDSRKSVDTSLKTVCEEFIQTSSHALTEPIRVFQAKAEAVISKPSATPVAWKQSFGSPDKVHGIVNANYRLLKDRLPIVLKRMSLYLANKDTEYILFKPIKANALQSYRQLSKLVANNYTDEEQQIIGVPTPEQVTIMLSMT
ncbi:conserved oligomeric Golgi complex subunit 3-like [Oscarella lobularis]|uniref:conserved oligomeric Golgi complex subunit 3-like n=1 Tax=Oscarella lobularis TaxID=121494 RepID=UPI003313D411